MSVKGDVVSTYVGPEGKNKKLSVKVDWAAGRANKTDQDAGSPAAPKGQEVVATSEDDSLTLAAEVDGKGAPTTVTMLDAKGKALWDAPAKDVASWSTDDGEVAITGVDVYHDPTAGGAPRGVVLVDRRSSIDADQGAVGDKTASALTVLDLATG